MQLIYHTPRSVRPAANRRAAGSDVGPNPGFAPAVDILEETARYVVKADLPGVDPGEIEITVEGDRLTLRGTRPAETAADGVTVRRTERTSGAFERIFRLPTTAASDGVEAKYRDGVLTISIPKSRAAMPYRIEVTAH